MAISLTAAIPVPNITRIVLARPPRFFDGAAVLDLEVRSSPANSRVKPVQLIVRNGGADGASDVIKANPTPTGFDSDVIVQGSALEVGGLADTVETAYRSGANKAAALRAVESALLAANVVQLAGTVP